MIRCGVNSKYIALYIPLPYYPVTCWGTVFGAWTWPWPCWSARSKPAAWGCDASRPTSPTGLLISSRLLRPDSVTRLPLCFRHAGPWADSNLQRWTRLHHCRCLDEESNLTLTNTKIRTRKLTKSTSVSSNMNQLTFWSSKSTCLASSKSHKLLTLFPRAHAPTVDFDAFRV